MNYQPKFYKYIVDAGANIDVLPLDISQLLNSFGYCLDILKNEPEQIQEKWMPILEQTDAVICAYIFRNFQSKIENTQQEKIRKMQLKAQSIKAKWNKN